MKKAVENLLDYILAKKKMPKMFNPYNKCEIKDIAPTITTNCGGWDSSATVLLIEQYGNKTEGATMKKNKQVIPNECETGDGLILFQSERMGGNKVLKNTSPTLKANKVDSCVATNNLRIRKLVPLETLKLMGFERKDEQAMREIGMSDMAIYHCAGDSIVTTCLMAIFGQMLLTEEETQQKIENYVETLKEN